METVYIKGTLTLIRTVTILTISLLLIASLALYLSEKPALQSAVQNSQAFYSSEEKLLRLTLSADGQYRLWVDLADIPHDFQKATLLYEDQYFYSHSGVNVLSLIRAAFSTYFTNGRRMGASTITMQLARLRSKLNTKTIQGKLNQIWQALVLERHYSKHQILEAYLNHAPYGHNIQGIAAASLCYFHKNPVNLTTAESLLLAVVPQNPNQRLPSTRAGLKAASKARQRLIKHWIKQTPVTGIEKTNLSLPLQVHSPTSLPYFAPHFVDQLIKQTSQDRHNTIMATNRPNESALFKADATKANSIKTTLSLNLQQKLEKLITDYIDQNQSKGLTNASVMVIDYTDMNIKAEIGSANYFNDSISGQVNGTRALRSPGSTLKPFIYALALEQGLIHPGSLLKDTPTRFNAYTPENYDTAFTGPISARDALVRSRNIPAVSLMQALNGPTLHEWLSQTKPRRLEAEEHYGLALALGGSEVSMVELLQWYATLANHGMYSRARSIVSTLQNKVGHANQSMPGIRLLTPEASFLTLDMLNNNPHPGKKPISKALSMSNTNHQDIPWKTGTSFAFRDAWSVGVVGHYVVGVWVGNFDGRANPAFVGRTAAGPLLFKISDYLQQTEKGSSPNWHDTTNLNVKQINVCKTSGDLETEHCPNIGEDWFIPGVSPIKSKRVFRQISIDIKSGLRTCQQHLVDSRVEVFEFWPSDIEQIFRNAGVIKKQPPPFMPQCTQVNHIDSKDAPNITSPIPDLTYALRSDRFGQDTIPLIATSASDANTLYWFIDNQFIGQTKPEQPALWEAKQGDFQVTVVDNIGRSSQTSIQARLVN